MAMSTKNFMPDLFRKGWRTVVNVSAGLADTCADRLLDFAIADRQHMVYVQIHDAQAFAAGAWLLHVRRHIHAASVFERS